MIESYNKEGVGRLYKTPAGDFPSVTTVLSVAEDKTWLTEWRNNVGDERADQIVNEACNIGTHLHKLFEDLLTNKYTPEPTTEEEKRALLMFNRSKAKLQRIVQEVLYMEEPVYSSKFRIAGRFDLLCKSKQGKFVLLDYKNTRSTKKREDIHSYQLQLAFYDLMIEETLGIKVDEHKIFMVNRDGFVQVFTFSLSDTKRSELVAIRKKFWETFGV